MCAHPERIHHLWSIGLGASMCYIRTGCNLKSRTFSSSVACIRGLLGQSLKSSNDAGVSGAQVRQLMYAAALLDTDQEPQTANAQPVSATASGSCTAANQSGTAGAGQTAGPVATAAEGLAALQLHVRSSNRFGPGTGAFLMPCYGTAELPQVRPGSCMPSRWARNRSKAAAW